jgi:hypothetical protein
VIRSNSNPKIFDSHRTIDIIEDNIICANLVNLFKCLRLSETSISSHLPWSDQFVSHVDGEQW